MESRNPSTMPNVSRAMYASLELPSYYKDVLLSKTEFLRGTRYRVLDLSTGKD